MASSRLFCTTSNNLLGTDKACDKNALTIRRFLLLPGFYPTRTGFPEGIPLSPTTVEAIRNSPFEAQKHFTQNQPGTTATQSNTNIGSLNPIGQLRRRSFGLLRRRGSLTGNNGGQGEASKPRLDVAEFLKRGSGKVVESGDLKELKIRRKPRLLPELEKPTAKRKSFPLCEPTSELVKDKINKQIESAKRNQKGTNSKKRKRPDNRKKVLNDWRQKEILSWQKKENEKMKQVLQTFRKSKYQKRIDKLQEITKQARESMQNVETASCTSIDPVEIGSTHDFEIQSTAPSREHKKDMKKRKTASPNDWYGDMLSKMYEQENSIENKAVCGN